MKKIFSLLVISVLFFGCKKTEKAPFFFDHGTVNDGVYDNTFFKFKLPINPDWYILDKNETKNIYKQGNKIVAGDNESLKEQLEASQVNLAKLFTAFKDQPGFSLTFNPSIIINAENVKKIPRIKGASDYFAQAKELMSKSTMKITYLEEKYDIEIGSQDFGLLRTLNTTGDIAITQDYYATVKNDFVLLIILSYDTEETKKEVYAMFDKLKI